LAPFAVGLGGTVRDALAAIDKGARGLALLVDAVGRLLGTISDGDIRRAILAGATLDGPVAGIARRDFVSVPPQADRAYVLDLMRARSIQQIPILDEHGRVVGIHSLRAMIGTVERENWAVIMAGGRGERLRPLTESIPKPMISVAGRPILERLVLHLVGFGIRRVFLAVNYMAEKIEVYFGDGSGHGCEILYLREDRPLGTGGALSLVPEAPRAPLLVLNGDLVTNVDVGAFLAAHEQGRNAITMAVHEHAYRVPFGVVDADREGSVRSLCEKPTERWTVNAGMYVVEPRLLRKIPRGEDYGMPDLMNACLQERERVGLYRIENDWIDVGHRAELQRARGEP
jgi:dTDP-glucose pyrophosphorylase